MQEGGFNQHFYGLLCFLFGSVRSSPSAAGLEFIGRKSSTTVQSQQPAMSRILSAVSMSLVKILLCRNAASFFAMPL
jgi:hypothetical protein